MSAHPRLAAALAAMALLLFAVPPVHAAQLIASSPCIFSSNPQTVNPSDCQLVGCTLATVVLIPPGVNPDEDCIWSLTGGPPGNSPPDESSPPEENSPSNNSTEEP